MTTPIEGEQLDGSYQIEQMRKSTVYNKTVASAILYQLGDVPLEEIEALRDHEQKECQRITSGIDAARERSDMVSALVLKVGFASSAKIKYNMLKGVAELRQQMEGTTGEPRQALVDKYIEHLDNDYWKVVELLQLPEYLDREFDLPEPEPEPSLLDALRKLV